MEKDMKDSAAAAKSPAPMLKLPASTHPSDLHACLVGLVKHLNKKAAEQEADEELADALGSEKD